jgi:hypothetical protein
VSSAGPQSPTSAPHKSTTSTSTANLTACSDRERQRGDREVWSAQGNHVGVLADMGMNVKFVYDHVFGGQVSNQQVYRQIASPIVQSSLDGINGTIFAYGVTSSGKTHTMMVSGLRLHNRRLSCAHTSRPVRYSQHRPDPLHSLSQTQIPLLHLTLCMQPRVQGTEAIPGVIPHTVAELFATSSNLVKKEFLFRMSMMEIYNEVRVFVLLLCFFEGGGRGPCT